jgi:hypothetical protein
MAARGFDMNMQLEPALRRHRWLTTLAIVGLVALVIYTQNPAWLLILLIFLPAIVADVRMHRNSMAIGVLNVIMVAIALAGPLAWPFIAIGWIIAMVWACTNPR